MILTEMVGDRIRHYSDQNFKIRQIETNIIYEDAVDIIPCPYTYEETDQLIDEPELEIEDVLNILLGGE